MTDEDYRQPEAHPSAPNETVSTGTKEYVTEQKARDYAKGYAAGKRTTDQKHVDALRSRVNGLLHEIERLKAEIPKGSYEGTIRYLLDTSETFVKAADAMIEVRQP